jgi:cytochrome c oxidase subunit II
MRKSAVAALLGIAAVAGALGGVVLAQENAPALDKSERVIRIVAKRFVFNPSEIVLKKGQPVVFELTTLDFGHGFSIPDLDFRADFVPDKVNMVRLTPQKSGKFEFLCDNFCGSGHEEMDGHMVVEE